jgi:hypothetical protein
MDEVDLTNKSVLIVEDSPTQALLLKEILEKNKLFIRSAKDGFEGLEQIEQSIPHLIISDIEMPRMNGYDFCKKVKAEEKYRELPVILLTNLTDPLDVIKGMDCGADSFLTKPCVPDLLFATIRNAIKNIDLRNKRPPEKISFYFGDGFHTLTINPVQITELLLSTYSSAIQKNIELERAYAKLNNIYEELEKNNKKLKELNEQKNQLLGMAAHDLKNPLSVISGFSNFLLNLARDDIDEGRCHQMIERINDSSTFMMQIIDDFLDFSTIESGTLSLHLSDIDLCELIQKDMLFFESLANKKGIKIIFKCQNATRKLRCDPNKISQVLNNLITNGIKFSHPQGILEISTIPSDHELTISVKDSGIGISSDFRSNLFQPFNRTKTKGTAGEKGTGLGLAIVNKIVLAHGGKIFVDSNPEGGTTFSVSLPYVPQ